MNKSIARTIPILIAVGLMLAGCAVVKKTKPTIVKPISSLAYKEKALEYEKKRNLTKALDYWKIAASIDPSDAKLKGKVALVEAICKSFARAHFKKGVAYYKKRQLENARKEFIIALRHDPENEQALNYLKNKFSRSVYSAYQVKKGDTYNRIAGKVYNDTGKGFLIASVNKLAFNQKPRPGDILKIPRLDNINKATKIKIKGKPSDDTEKPEPSGDMTIHTPEIIDIPRELEDAGVHYKTKNYRKVLSTTQDILEKDPQNSEALKLRNMAYLSMGKELELKKKYDEALNMFNEADADFEGVQEAIKDVKKQMLQEADEHYRRGIKQYLNDELAMAIEEWDKTLDLNPEHAKARKDIEKAKKLLEKLNEVKKVE